MLLLGDHRKRNLWETRSKPDTHIAQRVLKETPDVKKKAGVFSPAFIVILPVVLPGRSGFPFV